MESNDGRFNWCRLLNKHKFLKRGLIYFLIKQLTQQSLKFSSRFRSKTKGKKVELLQLHPKSLGKNDWFWGKNLGLKLAKQIAPYKCKIWKKNSTVI